MGVYGSSHIELNNDSNENFTMADMLCDRYKDNVHCSFVVDMLQPVDIFNAEINGKNYSISCCKDYRSKKNSFDVIYKIENAYGDFKDNAVTGRTEKYLHNVPLKEREVYVKEITLENGEKKYSFFRTDGEKQKKYNIANEIFIDRKKRSIK